MAQQHQHHLGVFRNTDSQAPPTPLNQSLHLSRPSEFCAHHTEALGEVVRQPEPCLLLLQCSQVSSTSGRHWRGFKCQELWNGDRQPLESRLIVTVIIAVAKLIECSLCAGQVTFSISFNPQNNLAKEILLCSHFRDEKTQAGMLKQLARITQGELSSDLNPGFLLFCDLGQTALISRTVAFTLR